MLTADLVKPRVRVRKSELTIDLLDTSDPHWLSTAADLIDLFQQFRGQSQADWQNALEMYEGERLDYVVVRGLAKVLTDAATFTPLATSIHPMQIRERAFSYGPVFTTPQLFSPKTHYEVIQHVADEIGIPAQQVAAMLFADRPATYALHDTGPAWTPESLLSRYNLELARGVLYWATQVQIEVHRGYKDLWKYLKLFKLMFWGHVLEDGYLLDLDGPISPFVNATTRYGRQFAAFLPALFLCERWRMTATIIAPQTGAMATYRLDYTMPFQSHFKQSGLFDSRLEADFAGEFEQKMGDKRGHWLLRRESEVLLLGDTVMIPDFTLIDDEDETRKILIELVGFWHPEYLRRKVEKVRAAHCEHLLLLVYRGLNIAGDVFQDTASEVIFFAQKPVLKEVMERVEEMAGRIYGPRKKSDKKNNMIYQLH
ncbi:MAG TPA: DUF790 family protein [Ktedonobacteraceae bacterium]|nr:DUF790 family protein [Ktedonobacteraceae bacterium]